MNATHYPIVIAEAGVNHCGRRDLALRLVEAAAEAGADYVKFQTFKAERLVTASAPRAEYQRRNMAQASPCDSQLDMLRALQLCEADHRVILDQCRQSGIGFISTPFDLESARFLRSLGMSLWKISSGDLTDYPLLREVARFGQPVILSTGMATLEDVGNAVKVLSDNGLRKEQLTLLHCNTQYPTPVVDVNLLAMETLRHTFDVEVGYSDHTEGLAVPVAAAALGACVLEKHFTLDRTLPGPDHRASLTPDELKLMVKMAREAYSARGSAEKCVSPSERDNILVARKSIVAARPIKCGETFTEINLTTKRPATGLNPMLWKGIIGTCANRDYLPDEQIERPEQTK